jgi:DHA1 family bicyclomycin/chloramphenicol resistance-like MFS transporter
LGQYRGVQKPSTFATAAQPLSRAQSARLVLILGALAAFGPLSIDMYLPAFPALQAHFAVGAGAVQATLAVFFAGLACGQPFYGPLSDRYGRRAPLLAGIALFALGSFAAALAPDIESFTVARLVQALGGCSGMVMARAMVADLFDERGSAKILSMLMLVMGLAPILAPLAGGQLLALLGWRAIFCFLGLFAILSFAAVTFGLGETHPPERRSAGGIAVALRAYGRLLRRGRFLAFAFAGAFAMAGLFAYITGSPFVFIQLHGVSPQDFGLLFGLNALGIVVASQVNLRLLRHYSGRSILAVATAANLAASLALVAVAASGAGGLALLMVPLFVVIASLGFIIANSVAAAMAEVERDRGSASALIGTLQFGIAAVVSGLLGALQGSTALPMALVIAGGAAAATAFTQAARRGA